MVIWWGGGIGGAVGLGAFEVAGGHGGVGNDNAVGVLPSVEFTAHGEAGFGGGGGDQLDDDPIGDEWLGTPVLADEGEEAVLDFVPLAGAGRQVVDHDVEAEFVGQLLQFAFPQPYPRTVAAAAVGGDQQSGGVGVARPPDGLPPPAGAVPPAGGRLMGNPHTHPSRICRPGTDPR